MKTQSLSGSGNNAYVMLAQTVRFDVELCLLSCHSFTVDDSI